MIINGKEIAAKILYKLKQKRHSENKNTALAAILIGNDQASLSFLKQKQKVAAELNINFKLYRFNETPFKLAYKKIQEICSAGEHIGIIIQLPLPSQFSNEQKQTLLNLIPPEKDIDMLSDTAFQEFLKTGSASSTTVGLDKPYPPSVQTLKVILEELEIDPKEKTFAIFGARGKLVGLPIALWLKRQNIKIFPIEIGALHPEKISRKADIIISAIGKPGYIREDFIKQGAILIDFGYGYKAGKIMGDLNIEAIKNKASAYTPTPGGTGPILVAALFKNLISDK